MYTIQHCFICRPSDSTVLEDAGIETQDCCDFVALTARRSNHSDRSHILKEGRAFLCCRLIGSASLSGQPLKAGSIYLYL